MSDHVFEAWELPYAKAIAECFSRARPFEFTDADTHKPEPWEVFRAEQAEDRP